MDFLKSAKQKQAKDNRVPEEEHEKLFCKTAEGYGCKPYKLILLAGRGWPDRTVLCPGGRIIFFEFKRPGKKQTWPQRRVMDTLKNLGFKYYVVYSAEEAIQILEVFADG